MKKLILLFLISFTCSANYIDTNCSNFVIWNAPIETSDQYLCRKAYGVAYNYKTKTPNYVVEHIISSHLRKNVVRKNNFHEDIDIPEPYRQVLKDYIYSKMDKGHQAPAADFTYDKVAMSESFLLSNMVPQNPNNNRKIWNHLESNIRSLTKTSDIYVITGTLFQSGHLTIGNNVSVPSELYKIVIDITHERMIAFRIPNESIEVSKLKNYVVSVKSIEEISNINYSPNIPKNLEHLENEVAVYSAWF